MATVINVAAIKPLLDQLGWGSLNISEALDDIRAAGISPADVLAYLTAFVANQTGFDDQTIVGCNPKAASQITAYLVNKGAVAADSPQTVPPWAV